jgi:hypothetical protein
MREDLYALIERLTPEHLEALWRLLTWWGPGGS